MKSLLAAVAFLTTIPVPVGWLDERQDYKKCVAWFPVVGVVIGGCIALIAWGLVSVVPALPAAVLIAGAMAVVSGALHLDGLADTADGFLSGRPRERVLEIMHDSRTGAMGVVAVVLVLLLRVSLLAEVCGMEGPYPFAVVALAPVCGRCSLVWSMQLNPYAGGDGLGRSYWHRSWAVSLVALAGLMAIASWLIGTDGLIGTGTALGLTFVFSLWCRRRIGGATGDTAGACCELTETGCLLAVVATVNVGGVP